MMHGRLVTNLDGGFKKDFPEPVVYSTRNDQGRWFVTKAGPRYLNVYEVTEYDDIGQRWLNEHENRE